MDGGSAQKNVAEFVLKQHEMVIPVVAVTKDEHHKPIKLVASKKLLQMYENDILLANAESHRFAISFHKEKRSKRMFAEPKARK